MNVHADMLNAQCSFAVGKLQTKGMCDGVFGLVLWTGVCVYSNLK